MSITVQTLIILGVIIAAALSLILVRADKARKKAEEENIKKALRLAETESMKEADERARTLFCALPVGCSLWDTERNIIDCNPAMLNLFGVKDKEEYLRISSELAPERQPCGTPTAELEAEFFAKAFDEGCARFEIVYKTRDGEELPVEVTLAAVTYNGKDAVAACYRDLSEQKACLREMEAVNENLSLARDAADAANEAKSTFLANMSHDIRTPMSSIVGFAELARDDNNPRKVKEYLGKILENGEWLLETVDDILDISKIESGKLELENIPFDMRDVFAHCRALILPKAEKKGIVLSFDTEPPIWRKLLGDPIRLRQALINLLSNAVKFTEAGSVRLLASVIDSGETTATVHFEVEDNGIGIDPKYLPKIFEPFTQGDSSIARKFGGTGMGLAITKNIIEMMGGTVNVISVVGAGSKFSFELTFDVTDDATGAPPRRIAFNESERPNFSGEILICEDNAMNRQAVCEHLGRVGIKTVAAEDGKKGVEIVLGRVQNKEKPFDLIFMDIHMPVMGGVEAASKIAWMGVKTPIVAMTANIMSRDIELYKQGGMNGYLGKPFTSLELWECLTQYLPVINFTPIDEAGRAEEKMLSLLKVNFFKENRTTVEDIQKAAREGNIELAHRLAHSLKGNAAQIGEDRLRKAAAAAEEMLSDGKNMITEEYCGILKTELNAVLEKLTPLMDGMSKGKQAGSSTKEDAGNLFAKLEDMLANRNPECMNLLDDIQAIPGTGELVKNIEDFEFKTALRTLSKLKEQYNQKVIS